MGGLMLKILHRGNPMTTDLFQRRYEEVAYGVAQLTADERQAIKDAACAGPRGGVSLRGAILKKAVQLALAYKATGRIRADVWKIFRGEK